MAHNTAYQKLTRSRLVWHIASVRCADPSAEQLDARQPGRGHQATSHKLAALPDATAQAIRQTANWDWQQELALSARC